MDRIGSVPSPISLPSKNTTENVPWQPPILR
jgi:hypothetical protein